MADNAVGHRPEEVNFPVDKALHLPKRVYMPSFEVEDFEAYTVGGYHPTLIGDVFDGGRYKVVHKLGWGGYSTTWLARDQDTERYVALKILVASETSKSREGDILRLLSNPVAAHKGQAFIPRLLNEFTFEGPNGRHICLVQEAAICTIADAKEDAGNFMFPAETARSIAAQLILGLAYLHSRGVCHGDLHMRNMLIYGPTLDHLSTEELYDCHVLSKSEVKRVDGGAPGPHAPPCAVAPLYIETPADELLDPRIKIVDYGTSFIAADEISPKLRTPPLYLPPEAFFNEPITLAADVWTLGVNLYDIVGERPLFETFACDHDDIIAEVVNTLGPPPQRWWDKWANRGEFFEKDGSWKKRSEIKRICTPKWRRLHQRMWEMGRGETPETCEWDVEAGTGETPETCEWDVEGGEMRALEDLLRGMLTYEPKERLTAEELVGHEYMVRWALPAWERQLSRQGREAVE